MKPLIMTMSGMRGITGENLHPQVALNMAMAFGAYLKKRPVIVGGDTRVSHEMLKNAVISGLISVGIDVIDGQSKGVLGNTSRGPHSRQEENRKEPLVVVRIG